MPELWVEELDGYLRAMLKTDHKLQKFNQQKIAKWKSSRFGRIEDFAELISTALQIYPTPADAPRHLKKAIVELRLARNQFTPLEYRLIYLCYGEEAKNILVMKYSTTMRKLLHRFLVKEDREALSEFFDVANGIAKLADERGDEENFKFLVHYGEMVDQAWAWSLIDGQLADS